MGSSQITNILNIRNENPEKIRLLTASTPCGKHEEYWEWCVKASRTYYPSKEDIENYQFNGYQCDTRKDGNGWVQVYSPSTVNKELLKINEDTNRTYIEDIRSELSEMRFLQEVMAEFGEEEAGVYRKEFIEAAVEEGKRINHRYILDKGDDYVREYCKSKVHSKFILGIDWDKYQAGTNMACIEYDPYFKNKFGMREPKFIVLFRIEIPKSRFTYTEAVNKVIELNDLVNFDHIAIDRGYGETQIEMLVKYGMANPVSGLEEKVTGYQFGQKIPVRDPHTGKKDEKPLKPFMVNNSVITFEKQKIVFDPTDEEIVKQFESYVVKNVSSTGVPIFSSEDEHIIDAVNLALLAFEQNYSDLMRIIRTSKVSVLGPILGKEDSVVKERDFTNYDNSYEYLELGYAKSKVIRGSKSFNGGYKKFNFDRRSF